VGRKGVPQSLWANSPPRVGNYRTGGLVSLLPPAVSGTAWLLRPRGGAAGGGGNGELLFDTTAHAYDLTKGGNTLAQRCLANHAIGQNRSSRAVSLTLSAERGHHSPGLKSIWTQVKRIFGILLFHFRSETVCVDLELPLNRYLECKLRIVRACLASNGLRLALRNQTL
jgi:hypothetical protein